MVWSWSHTREAYANAHERTHALDREVLKVAWAEVQTFKEERTEEFPVVPGNAWDKEVYQSYLGKAEGLPTDTLARDVWDFAEEWRTCDNGGYNAHLCPYGCHKVPWDPLDEDGEVGA